MSPDARRREHLLWFAVCLVLAAILFSLLWLPRTGLSGIRPDWLAAGFAAGLVVFLVALGMGSLRPTWRWQLGVVALLSLALLFSARFLSPSERTHLVEYGLLAILLKQALSERAQRGRLARSPGRLALVIALTLSVLDELAQAVLPGRQFDPRDLWFNALAVSVPLGVMALAEWVSSRR